MINAEHFLKKHCESGLSKKDSILYLIYEKERGLADK